ncbi:hypothetical protein DL95DRAFT_321389, partial [Leptodontidium sp. 2 PMI_412]
RHVGLGLITIIFALGALVIVSPAINIKSLRVISLILKGREIAGKGIIFLGVRNLTIIGALLRPTMRLEF